MKSKYFVASLVAAGLLAASPSFSAIAAETPILYEVRVTNMTRGVSFTPILVGTHRPGVQLYQLGEPPSEALAAMAEGGDTVPLANMISATPHSHTATSSGLLAPGHSVAITVAAHSSASHFSLAAMMLPTNDGFIALNDVPLPKGMQMETFASNGHDAGSEPNDELCANIPGPTCDGVGASPNEGGEGFVHIHGGIHGIGNLHPADYDWRNPVALITVRRMVQ